MALPSLDGFRSGALARGFNQVQERQWAPGTLVDTHTHPFDADAPVVQSEMWLTVAGDTRRLLPGDTFNLARDVPHAERDGAEGATCRVARRASA